MPLDPYDRLSKKWSKMTVVEASKDLTRFYTRKRFQLEVQEFEDAYVDGPSDGGIDFCYSEDGSHHLVQTKYSRDSMKVTVGEVAAELNLMLGTVAKGQGSARAEPFLRKLAAKLADPSASLEITWLTTKTVAENVVENAQGLLDDTKRSKGWALDLRFVAIDAESGR